jgi:hypothetical protein
MWYIGQVVRNPAGQRFIYAGFKFDETPALSYFRLEQDRLVQFRDSAGYYKELPGEPIEIGPFARALNAGFMGEISLRKLEADKKLYQVALETLKEPT